MKTYIHVNQHKIKANLKHGTDEPVITVKQGKKNTYCHSVQILGDSVNADNRILHGAARTSPTRLR
jgi:hypothetical protein